MDRKLIISNIKCSIKSSNNIQNLNNMRPCSFSFLLHVALDRIEKHVSSEFMNTVIPAPATGDDKTVKEMFEMLKDECVKCVKSIDNSRE